MRGYILFTMLLPVLVWGRLPAQSLNESDFTCYTRVQGLSNNSISGIVQDSTGYLWIATFKGLNRFDGHNFTNYYTGSADLPLPDNLVKHLNIQGREIIGTTFVGAFIYDTYSRKCRHLLVPSDSLIFAWTNNGMETLRDDKGHYIFSSKTGLYVFDSAGSIVRRLDHYLPSDARRKELAFGTELSTLGNGLVLQNNDLFFSTYDPVRNRIDTFYGLHDPVFKKALTDTAGELRVSFPGRKDQVFIVNEEKNAIDIFDLRLHRTFSFPMPFSTGADIDGYNSRLFFLSDSLLALTGKVSGFYLFDYYAGAHQLRLHGEKYFTRRHCRAVFRDREGRYWIGTDNGLYKQNLSSPYYNAYDLAEQWPDLRNCDIRAIYTSHDKLFVGLRNKGGLLMLDKSGSGKGRLFDFGKYGPTCNTIYNIFPFSADTLWIGTRTGLLWFNTSDYHFGRVIVPAELAWINEINPICMIEDTRKNIWISFGNLNSVVYYNRDARRFTDISGPKNPLLKITYCFSMAKDRQGNVWFAGDGLCRWNAARQVVDTLILYSSVARTLNSYIVILDMDNDNNLWLYSWNNGIIQYDCTKNKMYLRKSESNFWDGDIIASSPVIHDHIWLGIDNGISVFDIHNYSSRLYTYADGLPMAITSLRKGSWYDEGQNIFYVGSGHHLISFKPDLSHSVETPPALFIDEINTPAGRLVGDPERLTLSYTDNSARIDFNAVNFRSPEDNRFAYRVSPGPDTSWHLLNWQHSVNLSNLASGKYQVHLKLFSANNRWPEQVRELTIVVKPPFWRSWWFIILSMVVLISAVWFLYRSRIRRLGEKMSLDRQVAEYEMKALHAQMNPHFIFNSLNSIKEMILHQDTRNASLYLSRFAQLIRLNLEHSRKTFITLRQNIEYLESYLEMEQLRFADFNYHIGVQGQIDVDEIRIAPMLIQPLVENAIWHGLLPNKGNKQLNILFYIDEEKLVCEIEDNGIGIRRSLLNKSDSQQMHTSMGIGNVRQRIAILNEKYRIRCSLSIQDKSEISDAIDTGTVSKLIVPAY
ncbi:MAG TPA: histidine kinase, partial [Puia sp.]|nr:histidine kinase [Puia sp.]